MRRSEQMKSATVNLRPLTRADLPVIRSWFEDPDTIPKAPAADLIWAARKEVASARGTRTGRTVSNHPDARARKALLVADGRCWARTSDLRLVEAALSQLS